jgi:hypothetical protein
VHSNRKWYGSPTSAFPQAAQHVGVLNLAVFAWSRARAATAAAAVAFAVAAAAAVDNVAEPGSAAAAAAAVVATEAAALAASSAAAAAASVEYRYAAEPCLASSSKRATAGETFAFRMMFPEPPGAVKDSGVCLCGPARARTLPLTP